MRKGMTLLELMVVVAILGIVSTSSMYMYGQISKTNTKKTASQIVSSLSLARTGSMTKTGSHNITIRTDEKEIYLKEDWSGETKIGKGEIYYQIDDGEKTQITELNPLVIKFNHKGSLESPSCFKLRIYIDGRNETVVLVYGLTGVTDYE